VVFLLIHSPKTFKKHVISAHDGWMSLAPVMDSFLKGNKKKKTRRRKIKGVGISWGQVR
jgi:hypothetical protein